MNQLTMILVPICAIIVGYGFLRQSGSLPERPQTPYSQQDLVNLHDDLFLAHEEKLREHLDNLSSARFSNEYKEIQSARQLVGDNAKYDEVETKIKDFSFKLGEQERLKSELRIILKSSQKQVDFIHNQETIQKKHIEALNEAPNNLSTLRKQLEDVKKAQAEVKLKMTNRIELEKNKRRRTSELREEMKTASQHLAAMERKLRTHLRLIKTTEKHLEQIRRNRAEHSRKASTNSAELKQLEQKKISTESEAQTLESEREALEAEKMTNQEQKQLRVSALELLESLSLGEDLASTKASREKRLDELLVELTDLKAKGPSNLKVDSGNAADSDSLKKVGYFAQLAHNKKLTELENKIGAVKSEIQFINDFGTDDPKHLRQSLTKEVEDFDLVLARLFSREGQLAARIEDVKSRLTKVEAEIKQKRDFRDNANSQSAQHAVSEDQMESTLHGHRDNSQMVEANIERAREAEKVARKNLDEYTSIKLEDNTSSLNQEKLELDDQQVSLHRKIVALLGEHEKILAESQATDSEIRLSRSKFQSDLKKIQDLNSRHDQLTLEIQGLYGELQALFK